MRQVGRHLESDRSGYIKLIPEDDEDIWHLYNIILPGDRIEASTLRRVTKETATSKHDSERMRLHLMIQVESVDIDLSMARLNMNGRVCRENKHVKMGSYHTIDIEMQNPVKVWKAEWDSVALSRVHEALNMDNKAEMAAVVFQLGVAHVCLLTDYTTLLKQKIEVQIPKKNSMNLNPRDKAVSKFYDQIYTSMKQNILFDKMKVILLASPGFYKEDLYQYILAQASKNQEPDILQNTSKFLLISTSNGYLNALQEILADPRHAAKLSATRASRESKLLEEFFSMMRRNPERAYYGYDCIVRANERKAVQTLLISSTLFRSSDLAERKKYVALFDSVTRKGGSVHVFSSGSTADSSSRLDQLTGVAAILTYAIPESDMEFQ